MIDTLLHARLQPVIELRRKTVLWGALALVWGVAALVAGSMVWLQRHDTEVPQKLALWLVPAALAASLVCWWRARTASPNLRRLASQLESRHPSLDGRLLTAIQQVPDKKGDYGFLQDRLFEDAVRHSVDHNWEAIAPAWRVTAGRIVAGAAMAASIWLVAAVRPTAPPVTLASTTGGETTPDGVTVTPGDVSLERGSTLTVMARFDREVPAAADLVIGGSSASEQRVPLVRSLADPVFGGTRADVTDGFVYRIDYGGRRTRDFRVLVFEFPRLERSDIELTYPSYTGQPVQRIEDTRRVSAVEGTRLAVALQLNKPVATASLVPKEPKAATLALTVDPERAVAQLLDFPLATSQSYDLRLVDADGRSNKVPDLFVFEALPNRPPELKLAAPRGDQRPSALEEIGFEGTAWDDFGVLAFGVAISRGGQPAEFTQLGQDVPAKEKAGFHHLLQLESLAAKPDELWSWFVWADDIGPDGQRRRTQGDLFFAEVRPFDEIFREGAGMEGGAPPEGQPPGGAPATKLAELQKQIINATWKLQRVLPPEATFATDVEVVRESQQQAIDQANEAAAEVDAPMRAALWSAVTGEMEKARDRLAAAPAAPAVLPEALAAEQSAYQALLKLRERETEVNRSQQPQSGQASAGEQQRQEELDELDLAQAENRYETQRQAQPQQDAERRARLQAQNRLQELAQRQEDVNEKLKELQSALQAAADDPQREELRRQLKRLEEEQRQMLADLDELRQRMDQPEAQSQMSQQRQQLDQTRQDAQRAAEAASRGEVGQALAAGTRAQRQLQEMREQLRKEGAGQMGDELREMRAEARDLARQQKAISESLAGSPEAPAQRPSLSDSPEEQKPLEQLDAQRERTAALVDRATRLSDEAEGAEPLVSRQLYDTLRQFSQADASSVKKASEQLIEEGAMTQDLYRQLEELKEKPAAGQALSLTAELLRAELPVPAQRAAGQAQAGLEQLRGGLEVAAEKVLGDDTAALEAAEKELEALAAAVAQEAATARDPARPQGAATPPSEQPGDAASGQASAGTAAAGGPQGTEGTEGGQASEGTQASQRAQRSSASPAGQSGAGGATPSGPGDSASQISRLLAGGGEANGGRRSAGAPMMGEGFTNWSDRLREVEEMIEFPDLRNAVASARERARVLRLETGSELKKPDWAVVELEILKPLVEVRRQVRDELRRRSSDEPLAPIDRDPVPERFAELVRRYYEELGKDR